MQDAYAVSAIDKDYVFAVVSDGAGSAKFGAYGAWLVCRNLKVKFREWLSTNRALPDDQTLIGWINDLKHQISEVAKRRETAPRQFAATVSALLISPEEILSLHIGDCAIVGRCHSQWKVVCWPASGEYASTTFFVTDEPNPRLHIGRKPLTHDAFALFSDGVGDLALSQLERVAHSGFFEPMIKSVDSSTSAGRLPDLSGRLHTFLAGPSVCERTDDDKTLILLSGA